MKTWVFAVASVVSVAMVATGASADEYQDEMKEMRELVLQLQDQMTSQQEQIDTQKQVIDEAGLEDERGSGSRLSAFLETTDFSGWVAASYFFNTNNPKKNNPNGAASPYSNPFHSDPNAFQLDEAWFVMDRPATEESPAGFHFEITYGATASALSNSTNSSGGIGNLGGNDLWIPAANVSYMTPFGPTITAGIFGTTIGYEVAGAPSNVNITRGFTYNLFQPFSQIGALVSQDFDNGFTYTIGGVNGVNAEQPDSNRTKGLLWQLGWGNDEATLLFNGYYTPDAEGSPDDQYILDVVAEFVPADNLLFWANFDYVNNEISGDNPWSASVAVGGRVGVTDKAGIGARFEYAHLDDDGLGGGDGDLYSITGTTDYALTDNLTWKLEAKYERATDDLNNVYSKGVGSAVDDAVYVGTQLYYEF